MEGGRTIPHIATSVSGTYGYERWCPSKRSYRRCHGILGLTCFSWEGLIRQDLDDHVGCPRFGLQFYWKKIAAACGSPNYWSSNSQDKQEICSYSWYKGWMTSKIGQSGAWKMVCFHHERLGEDSSKFWPFGTNGLKPPPPPRPR